MDKRPIRRKEKDNPYILESIEKQEIYVITFKDSTGKLNSIKVNKAIFDVFDESEKYDNSYIKTYTKRIIKADIDIENFKSDISVENQAINNINIEKLKYAIEKLPKIQKERLKKYYFEEKTLEEIAIEEHCSKVAVKYTIDVAIKNLLKKFNI